jgi:hypothetical protein
MNGLEQRMYAFDHLQHEIQNVDHSVQNISSEVHIKMDEFLQEQLWLPEKGYQITNVDVERNTIDVKLEWRIRDLLEKEQMAFLYREKSSEEWTELDVNHNGGLNYSLEYSFPLKGNYETQVIAASESGKRSEDLMTLNFQDQLNTRIMTDAYLHPVGDGHYDVNINIHNSLGHEFMIETTKDIFNIKTANAFLYLDGELKKEWNLLKKGQEHESEFYHDFHSDQYSENINYHELIRLEEEVEGKAELRVIIEDGLGLQYETKVDSEF